MMNPQILGMEYPWDEGTKNKDEAYQKLCRERKKENKENILNERIRNDKSFVELKGVR